MRAALLVVAALLVLAGCGGSAKETTATTLVATLGDSITAGSPGYDPDPRMRETLGFGADEKSQWQYWAAKVDHSLRFRNCGIYGQRTDEIAAGWTRARRARRCSSSRAGSTTSRRAGRSSGPPSTCAGWSSADDGWSVRVALVELLPWNNGYPEADPKIRRLNGLIHELGRDEAVPCCRSTPRSRTRSGPAGCGRNGRPTATTLPSRATACSASARSGFP